jgi:hypothetical protein
VADSSRAAQAHISDRHIMSGSVPVDDDQTESGGNGGNEYNSSMVLLEITLS